MSVAVELDDANPDDSVTVSHLRELRLSVDESIALADARCQTKVAEISHAIAGLPELVQMIDALTMLDPGSNTEFRRRTSETNNDLLCRLIPALSTHADLAILAATTRRQRGVISQRDAAVRVLLDNPRFTIHCRDLVTHARALGAQIGSDGKNVDVNRLAGILDMRLREAIGRGAQIERVGPRLYRAVSSQGVLTSESSAHSAA